MLVSKVNWGLIHPAIHLCRVTISEHSRYVICKYTKTFVYIKYVEILFDTVPSAAVQNLQSTDGSVNNSGKEVSNKSQCFPSNKPVVFYMYCIPYIFSFVGLAAGSFVRQHTIVSQSVSVLVSASEVSC